MRSFTFPKTIICFAVGTGLAAQRLRHQSATTAVVADALYCIDASFWYIFVPTSYESFDVDKVLQCLVEDACAGNDCPSMRDARHKAFVYQG